MDQLEQKTCIHVKPNLLEVITRYLLFVGFLLDKKIGVNQPKRVENAKILIANTPMDTDKIKVLSFMLLQIWCDACLPLL